MAAAGSVLRAQVLTGVSVPRDRELATASSPEVQLACTSGDPAVFAIQRCEGVAALRFVYHHRSCGWATVGARIG